MNKKTLPWLLILIGALALWLGTANQLLHLPLLIIFYPTALAWLGLTSQRPFRLGWLCGALGSAAGLYWIAVPVHYYGYFPMAVGVLSVLALGAYLGLYAGLYAWLLSKVKTAPLWRLTLAAVLIWFLLEWTRNWFLTGFPWLTLASGLAAWPVLIQVVSLLGEYLFSGLLAGLGLLLALSLIRFQARQPASWRPALVASVALLLVAGFGVWRLHSFEDEGETLRLSLIQGNLRQDLKWDPAWQQATLDRYLDLSKTALAAAHGEIDLVIWPETAMPFFYTLTPEFDSAIRAFAGENQVALLLGSPGLTRFADESVRLYNRAFLVDRFGFDQSFYDKEHLVPIVEYLPPIFDWEKLSGRMEGMGAYSPGQMTEPFVLYDQFWQPRARLGLLICYEAIFPELARKRVQQGAQALINTSNDAWFDRTSAPVQHLYASVLRAVEQERWLARATNTGLTAFVDPLGRINSLGKVTDGSGLFISAWKNGNIGTRDTKTVFYYLQPLLPALAFIGLLPILWLDFFASGLRASRRKPLQTAPVQPQ